MSTRRCRWFGHRYESLGDVRVPRGITQGRRCARCRQIQIWSEFTIEARIIETPDVTLHMLGRRFADWIDADEVPALPVTPTQEPQ